MGKKKNIKKILEENWEEIAQLASSGVEISTLSSYFNVPVNDINAKLKKENQPSTTPIKGKQDKKLNILILDIENAPMMSYHWGVWKQNIGEPMRIEGNRSYMMSIAMKWLDEDKIHYFETRTEDDSELIGKTLPFLDKADIIVAHNGKAFDMKKINAYAIQNNLKPPSPYRQIDTLIEARKHFLFERNTLSYIATALDCSPKLDHGEFSGFSLWKECMAGNKKAWAEMKKYNIQDIRTLEEVYLKMRPYIKGHPNVVTTAGSGQHRCTACGSYALKPNGFSITNVSKFARYICSDCGSFSRGRKNELTKVERDNLLTSVANG
mgnify:FL=1|jgi:hypothetical protein